MGRGRVWLLLLCNASLATYATAETPYVYTKQLFPVQNQPVLSQSPPFQYATMRFHPETNDKNFKAYGSQASNSPHALSLDSYPFTPEEAMKEFTGSVPTSALEDKNSALYSTGNPIKYKTLNLLPIYQYMQLRYAPLSTNVKDSFKIVVPDSRTDTPDKPIAVVAFKPPKRKPSRVSSQPPASPPRPESPSAPSTTYTAPSAPYTAPSAPYTAPSAPYTAPSAPYAAPSAPYPATLASEPSTLYSSPRRATGDGPNAPAYSAYYSGLLGYEGDYRSGIFLGNSDLLSKPSKVSFIFMRVRGRGLFDVDSDGGGALRLGSASYSYLSPENVPVYMLDVSR